MRRAATLPRIVGVSDAPPEVPAGLEAALRRGYEQGRAEHGALPLTGEEFGAEVLSVVCTRRRALGLACDGAALAEALRERAFADLYLARACEHGSEAAWKRLTSLYTPRLVGLVRRREGGAADAEGLVSELFGELALAPAGGTARTRLGTFDGSGSLWGWLAAALVRRILAHARGRERTVGDLGDRHPAPSPSPAEPLLAREAAEALDRALADAWRRLEPDERCAVLWKHRHGLSQRRIAALLGVREDRVSRWIDRALAKLRGAVLPAVPGGAGEPGTARWEAVLAVLGRRLASLDAWAPLPQDEPRSGMRP